MYSYFSNFNMAWPPVSSLPVEMSALSPAIQLSICSKAILTRASMHPRDLNLRRSIVESRPTRRRSRRRWHAATPSGSSTLLIGPCSGPPDARQGRSGWCQYWNSAGFANAKREQVKALTLLHHCSFTAYDSSTVELTGTKLAHQARAAVARGIS